MARKKTPAGRIAKKLKRTEGATRQKAFSLGLSLDFALTNRRVEFFHYEAPPPRGAHCSSGRYVGIPPIVRC